MTKYFGITFINADKEVTTEEIEIQENVELRNQQKKHQLEIYNREIKELEKRQNQQNLKQLLEGFPCVNAIKKEINPQDASEQNSLRKLVEEQTSLLEDLITKLDSLFSKANHQTKKFTKLIRCLSAVNDILPPENIHDFKPSERASYNLINRANQCGDKYSTLWKVLGVGMMILGTLLTAVSVALLVTVFVMPLNPKLAIPAMLGIPCFGLGVAICNSGYGLFLQHHRDTKLSRHMKDQQDKDQQEIDREVNEFQELIPQRVPAN